MHLLRWINERPTDDSPPPTAVLAMLALALAENGELAAADALGEASRSIRIAGKETTLSRFVEEHVNRNTAPAPQFPTDRPMGAPTWLQKDTSDDHPSNPTVIANGRVFRLTPDRLTARDLTSGKLLWARTTHADETPLPPDRSPRHRARALSVANGVCVFVRQATRDTRSLLAVHSKTGATLWQRTAKNPSPNDHSASKSTLLWSSAALVTEDSIHIGAHDTASQPNSWLVTLDLSSGQERWRTRIGGGVPLPFETRAGQLPRPETWVSCTRPALIAGSILVGDNLGTLAALDFRTGQPIWVYRYERRRAVNTSRFGQSSLKRGWDDSSIHAEGLRFVVSPEDSDRAFCFFTNPPPVSDRPLSHVDFVLNDVWERSGLSRVLGFNNGTVYLAGRDRSEDLDVVEAWTPAGEEHLQAWSSPAPMDTPVAGALIVGDNGLYVSTDKYVYCINRSSGEVSNPLITHEASPGLFLGDLYLTREGLLIAAPMGLSFWSHGK